MNSIICALLAATSVYRLELVDEKSFIVGQDGIRREVCLVDPAEYAIMTGRVDHVWRSLNSTPDGRRALHGKIVKTDVDTNAMQSVETYADGFRHHEKMVVKVATVPSPSRRARMGAVQSKPSSVSDRQWQMRQRLIKSRGKKPKEVTIVHDAVTGKDAVR